MDVESEGSTRTCTSIQSAVRSSTSSIGCTDADSTGKPKGIKAPDYILALSHFECSETVLAKTIAEKYVDYACMLHHSGAPRESQRDRVSVNVEKLNAKPMQLQCTKITTNTTLKTFFGKTGANAMIPFHFHNL